MTAPVPSVRVARPSVPPPVEEAITRALAKVPADRFPTGEAFSAALEGGRSGCVEKRTLQQGHAKGKVVITV